MLIVNLNTLQTVYILNFVHDVLLYCCRTFNSQDISRSDSTIWQRSSGTYIVVFLNKDLLWQSHKVLLHIACLRCNDNFTVTTFNLTHRNLTIDFWNNSRIRWVTCFEQFGYTWKTTGDITCLTNCTWNLNQNITGLNHLLVFNNYVTTYRQVICTNDTTIFIQNMQWRDLCLIFRFCNDDFTQTCSFIRFYLICYIFNYRFKVNLTCSFCNNNGIERVPLSNQLTFLNDFTIWCIQFRTIRNVMCWQDNTCINIHETNFSQTTNNDLNCFTCFFNSVYCTQFFKLKTCIVLRNNTCICSHVTGDTSSVERTQCQLSTRFTDWLSSDNTNSLTFLNHTAGSKVTSITLSTYTLLRLTCQYRTDFNAFNRRIFDFLCNWFCNFFTSSYYQLTSCRMYYIVYRNTSQNTFIQCCNNFIVILQCCTNQTTQCSTVFFINDHVVRNVNQTTSQISGIGSFQRSIGKTLTSTVSRNKVLQHWQTFLKVRKNRVFNNLSTFSTCFLRFSHQTTHTRQLTDLFLRTTGSRIQHHKYRVESLIVILNSLIQDIRQVAVNVCPSINNLIVTFVVGDETHVIVHHNLLNLFVTTFNQFFLFFRDNDITQVEWQTTFESFLIT